MKKGIKLILCSLFVLVVVCATVSVHARLIEGTDINDNEGEVLRSSVCTIMRSRNGQKYTIEFAKSAKTLTIKSDDYSKLPVVATSFNVTKFYKALAEIFKSDEDLPKLQAVLKAEAMALKKEIEEYANSKPLSVKINPSNEREVPTAANISLNTKKLTITPSSTARANVVNRTDIISYKYTILYNYVSAASNGTFKSSPDWSDIPIFEGYEMSVIKIIENCSENTAKEKFNQILTEYNALVVSNLEVLQLNASINKEDTALEKPTEVLPDDTCTDGWWGCAYNFFSKAKTTGGETNIGGLDDIVNMIFDIGNIIIILVTSILGVKYIWGSVESKASVKNSLLTLLVATLVFYGGKAIAGDGGLFDIQEILTGSNAETYEGITATVYSAIIYIINFLAIGGIIYIGIKYMLAGADGKAEMKVKMIPVMLGIVMVYGTVNFLNFILKVAGII